MVTKNFTKWLHLKSRIDEGQGRPIGYKSREIWWMHLGLNIGFEEDGKGISYLRPVLVLKVFNRQLFWGLPLTSRTKGGIYYFTFRYGKYQSTAILSQLRAFDSKRLVGKFGEISNEDYLLIQEKLRKLI